MSVAIHVELYYIIYTKKSNKDHKKMLPDMSYYIAIT